MKHGGRGREGMKRGGRGREGVKCGGRGREGVKRGGRGREGATTFYIPHVFFDVLCISSRQYLYTHFSEVVQKEGGRGMEVSVGRERGEKRGRGGVRKREW